MHSILNGNSFTKSLYTKKAAGKSREKEKEVIKKNRSVFNMLIGIFQEISFLCAHNNGTCNKAKATRPTSGCLTLYISILISLLSG